MSARGLMTAVAGGLAVIALAMTIIGIPLIIYVAVQLQLRINRLRRSEIVEGKSWIDRWARHWFAWGEELRAKAAALGGDGKATQVSSQPSAAVQYLSKPDRTPEEVDAIQREARRVRLSAARPTLSVTDVETSSRSVGAKRRWREVDGAPTRKSGRLACFVYVDVDGVVTDRNVTNWSIAFRYLDGWCSERKAMRTFRLDRIDSWQRWE